VIFGLGGGNIPMFFRHHYPDAHIDVVEMDAVVVDVAERFFNYRTDSALVSHVSEGRQYLDRAAPPAPYDLIIQDACPQPLCAITVLEGMHKLAQLLRPDGVLVSNTWKYQVCACCCCSLLLVRLLVRAAGLICAG
jgi:spermidine synthase